MQTSNVLFTAVIDRCSCIIYQHGLIREQFFVLWATRVIDQAEIWQEEWTHVTGKFHIVGVQVWVLLPVNCKNQAF